MTRRHRFLQASRVIVGCIAILTPSMSLAQDAALADLIARLSDDSLIERDAAAAELAMGERFKLSELEAELVAGELDPEQSLRLSAAAALRFRASPRGAIGVQLDTTGQPRIVSTIEGFDADTKLRPGDVVVTIAGEPIESLGDLRTVIISHDPGKSVEMLVERQGKRLSRMVRLGAFNDLGRNAIYDNEYDAAWSFRLRRKGLTSREELRAPLDQNDWTPPEEDSEARRDALPEISVGGEARSNPGGRAFFQIDRPLGATRAERARVFRLAVNEYIAVLVQQLEQKRRTIAVQQSQLRRRPPDDASRPIMQRAIEANRRDIARLNAEIQRFERLLSQDG